MGNVPLGFERKRVQLDEGEKVKAGQTHSGTWLHLVLSLVIRAWQEVLSALVAHRGCTQDRASAGWSSQLESRSHSVMPAAKAPREEMVS